MSNVASDLLMLEQLRGRAKSLAKPENEQKINGKFWTGFLESSSRLMT